MGARKRNTAELRKEAAKSRYQAVLRNCPTSPRKMRLVTGLIKGVEVNRALDILRFSQQEASRRLEKLLMSAIANWQAKNEGVRVEESNLYVKTVSVDGGRVLKRLQTAPQGRAYRVRKRSNHVTLVLDSINKEVEKNDKTE
jgi:large subunit ribosomal protein L22